MKEYTFGDPAASNILVQMADDHDLSVIESEVSLIREYAGSDFFLIVIKVDDWNRDLSPWKAPAVFGNEDFGDGAEETLKSVLSKLEPVDHTKHYYIGGYSLAGLFALWSICHTGIFSGVAAASPSVWFPGFLDYMRENDIRTETVYLSLGDREEKTRQPVMSAVGSRIRDMYGLLKDAGVNCVLEWNKGNHFKEPDRRTAKAFAWVMQNRNVRSDNNKAGGGETEMAAKTIYLAGGCFWGMQKFFDQFEGVLNTEVGYANGPDRAPTYRQVCSDSGHAETVRIDYDENKISLEELLGYYFMVIDPLSVNRQGNDTGIQYRTGIYYTDEFQLPQIKAVYQAEETKAGEKLAVELEPLVNFFPAEEYHQKYLDKNPGGYCHIADSYFRLEQERDK